MVYMGSKARYAKYIVPILQDCIDKNNVEEYCECFVGGANIIDKINCAKRIGYDFNEYLIALLKDSANNPDKYLNLELNIPKIEWDLVRDNKDKYPAEYVGLVAFMASYCAGGFGRGYGRSGKDKHCVCKEHFNNYKKQIPLLKGIEFDCKHWTESLASYLDRENCLIYLDPPYKNTKHYDVKEKFDYDSFYKLIRQVAEKNYVFISEEYMPEDFKVLFEIPCKRNIRSTRMEDGIKETFERFYTIGKSLEN